MAEATLTPPDGPKMLRETLCVAQTLIGICASDGGRREEHIDRLQVLIDQLDVHRPLGPDGKHGERHTPTCDCARRSTTMSGELTSGSAPDAGGSTGE